MTHAALKVLALERLGEPADGSGYYSAAHLTDGLNWAQRFVVLLTLCLEDSASFTLTAGVAWYHVRTQITDWLLPLRVEYAGARVRPARLEDLESLNANWQITAGNPERYACLGLDLFAVYRQLAAGGTLSLTYARGPDLLSAANDSPEIPEEYHELLVDGAIAYCRLVEGGQEFQKVAPGLGRLLEGARQLAGYARTRSLDQRYDRLPPDLARFDWSRLLPVEKRRPPEWLITSQSRPAPEPT